MDLNLKIAGRIVAMLALAFLAQGIAYSHAPLAFVVLSGATAVLFFLSRREYRDKLPFVLTAIGPLVNFVAYQRSPYIYNIEVVLLTYLGLWFFFGPRPEHPIHLARTDMLYLGFILVVFLSTTVHLLSGDDPLSQIRLVRGFVMGLLLFWFLHSLGDRLRSLLPALFGTTLLAFAVIVTLGLAQYANGIAGKQTWLTEPTSVFDGSESFAIYLVTMLPLALAFVSLSRSRLFASAKVFIAAAGLLALITTRSRAGLLAISIYCIGRLLSEKSQKLRLAGVLAISVLATSIFWITLAKSGLLHIKTLQRLGHSAGMIFSSRIHPWTEGLSAISTSPFWGHGAHENVYNVFLQVGAQFGGVAILVFTVFIMARWLQARPSSTLKRSPEYLDFIVFWSLTTFLIISLAESTLGNQFGYLCWFVIHLSAGSMQTGMSELSHSSIVNRRFLTRTRIFGKNCMGHAAFLSPTLKIGDYWPSSSCLVALLRLSSKGLSALC